MTGKALASAADLLEKKVALARISERACAYTAGGDRNAAIVVGDDGVTIGFGICEGVVVPARKG